jgi:hypothetical protein
VEIRVKDERFMRVNGSIGPGKRQDHCLRVPAISKGLTMQIPRYWVRVTIDAQGRPLSHPPRTDNLLGRRPGTWAFGWSDISLEDAR